jgi:hypothetical protein
MSAKHYELSIQFENKNKLLTQKTSLTKQKKKFYM